MRRESPTKRRNPSGEVVWVARYTGRDGKRRVAKPSWNRGKGTFVRKSEAQRAIDEAYEIAATPDTLGEYFATWIERHPKIRADERNLRAPGLQSDRRRDRGCRPEQLADT